MDTNTNTRRFILEATADDWRSTIYIRSVRRIGPPSMTFSTSDAWGTSHRHIADRWKRETETAMASRNPAWQVRVIER